MHKSSTPTIQYWEKEVQLITNSQVFRVDRFFKIRIHFRVVNGWRSPRRELRSVEVIIGLPLQADIHLIKTSGRSVEQSAGDCHHSTLRVFDALHHHVRRVNNGSEGHEVEKNYCQVEVDWLPTESLYRNIKCCFLQLNSPSYEWEFNDYCYYWPSDEW